MKILFLGAGASIPAGYPSGTALLDEIERYFDQNLTDESSRLAWRRFVEWRNAATTNESTRLILNSSNLEVFLSFLDLVEQAKLSEDQRLYTVARERALSIHTKLGVMSHSRPRSRSKSSGTTIRP